MADLRDFKGTVMELLGIEHREVTREKIVLTMPVTPRTHQPWGYLHGGVSVVLAETAATMGACMNIDQDRQMVMGVEINANHVRSVRSGRVTGTARPIHRGGRLQVWDIRVVDDQGRLACISRLTVATTRLIHSTVLSHSRQIAQRTALRQMMAV